MMVQLSTEVNSLKNLFRPDSGLMIFMSQVTDCIFLSMFFMVGCMPVVTMGASFAALYDAMYRGFRRGEKNTWIQFWKTYRRNWKASILPTLLFLVATYGLCYGLIQCWNGAVYGTISWSLFAGLTLVGMVLAGMLSLLFPMLSRFENPLGALVKNTVVLALANLPRALALGILNVVTVILCERLIAPVFLLPGLAALISTVLIEPIFKPFMPEEAAD